MKEPIRVLHVVTLMNCGGLETMIMNYYRHIDRNKVQFDFLEHRSGQHDFTDEIFSLGGKIYTVPSVNPLNLNGYINAIDRFFQKNRYKIVHSHIDCMSVYPLKYAMKYDAPVRIAHTHSSNQDKDFKYPIKIYAKHQISKFATDLFACGENAGKWMFGKNNFNILNNAIDAKRYDFNKLVAESVKKELGVENKFVIGHVGRFSKVKNHSFLIDIFKELILIYPNSRLILVGTGETMDVIKKKVMHYNLLDKVIFLGLRNDINRLMQAFDIFVLPSLYEGLPVTIVEAQASGLRCIISDKVPEQCCFTDNVMINKLSVNPKEWANKIIDFGIKYDRKSTYDDIVKGGYDIYENAKSLQDFYLSKIKNNN